KLIHDGLIHGDAAGISRPGSARQSVQWRLAQKHHQPFNTSRGIEAEPCGGGDNILVSTVDGVLAFVDSGVREQYAPVSTRSLLDHVQVSLHIGFEAYADAISRLKRAVEIDWRFRTV